MSMSGTPWAAGPGLRARFAISMGPLRLIRPRRAKRENFHKLVGRLEQTGGGDAQTRTSPPLSSPVGVLKGYRSRRSLESGACDQSPRNEVRNHLFDEENVDRAVDLVRSGRTVEDGR